MNEIPSMDEQTFRETQGGKIKRLNKQEITERRQLAHQLLAEAEQGEGAEDLVIHCEKAGYRKVIVWCGCHSAQPGLEFSCQEDQKSFYVINCDCETVEEIVE